ncbi:MAG: hypothetical protein ACXWVD_05880, partial [Telluria sp.]
VCLNAATALYAAGACGGSMMVAIEQILFARRGAAWTPILALRCPCAQSVSAWIGGVLIERRTA